MMQIMASGQCWAQAAVRVATMEALVLNRSSRVMPENDPIQDVHKARSESPSARPGLSVVTGKPNVSGTAFTTIYLAGETS